MNNQPTLEPYIIRKAIFADIPGLAQLHVVTWNATYPDEPHKPTYEIREYQWRQAFEQKDKNWFCFVIENKNKELIGFAKGKKEKDGSGNLNKIYLLGEYQLHGLGRLLVSYIAREFLQQNISSMFVVADAQNSSCAFYEALGGVKKINKDTSVAIYVWRDLSSLASMRPVE